MFPENLRHVYTLALADPGSDGFRWVFCAGLREDDDGATRVYVYGQDGLADEPVWLPVSIAAIGDAVRLDGDGPAERALVCAVAAQVLEDLADLSEEDDAPAQLRALGAQPLRDAAKTSRVSAAEFLESRGPRAVLTPLEESIWDILAGSVVE
jgi:hypothetical protein